jgi:hypothetical protein
MHRRLYCSTTCTAAGSSSSTPCTQHSCARMRQNAAHICQTLCILHSGSSRCIRTTPYRQVVQLPIANSGGSIPATPPNGMLLAFALHTGTFLRLFHLNSTLFCLCCCCLLPAACCLLLVLHCSRPQAAAGRLFWRIRNRRWLCRPRQLRLRLQQWRQWRCRHWHC